METEPILKLAISVNTNPGAYALLLGSGVSRAAGILTGWEVVLDLIHKVAAAEGQEPDPDPESWYQQTFGEPPDYSRLLDRLTATSTERTALLRSYFEPTEEEREQGLKTPTPAHHAIAKLAKLGYIRMILTTNFDRLTEMALQEEGIIPDIISSDDTLQGSMPYIHSQCVVVKLHGDYRDTRIKNTPEELSEYSQAFNDLLDRVFDEFGLIICGWSGAWDTALRNAILRSPNRRFATYWLARGEVTDEAQRIIQHRRADVVQIESADSFFAELLEKVESLRELDRPHPLSTAAAVATVKRYLPIPQHRIRLHDLIHEETERVHKELASERFNTGVGSLTKEMFRQRMHQYEATMERLMAMLAALGYHDRGENAHLVTRCIELLIQPPRLAGSSSLINLQFYPSLLIAYAAGIPALAAGQFRPLEAILVSPTYDDPRYRDGRRPAISELSIPSVFSNRADKWVPYQDAQKRFTPASSLSERKLQCLHIVVRDGFFTIVATRCSSLRQTASDYLLELLRPVLRDYIPNETKYERTFDIFEYILALAYMDLAKRFFIGRFGWRYTGTDRNWEESPIAEFVQASLEMGEESGLLQAGFFDGSVERFAGVVADYQQRFSNTPKGWF